MTERLQAIVGAKITEFRKRMAKVKAIAKTVPNKIVVDVEARVDKFQRRMDKLANTIRTFGTVFQNALGGGLLMISPGIVPIIAALVGLLGSLGPMLGVIGGSAFALATAFGFAGTAAVAFGALAIPTISALFDETKKLTRAQKGAKKTFDDLKSTWKGISKELEPRVLEAFSRSMIIANEILEKSKPLFKSSADAVNNLLESLKQSIGTPPVQKFFDYMNKSAGPMLETLGKAFGNFMQGFMSMMVAFGPLAEETAQGFLKMSQGFAKWADGLSESKKFQSFVKYIQKNMPKIKSIFGDAIVGMINMFAAFGPLASDMMTGLQNMMSRFKEWSATLGKNQQFQQFIGYIRDNAPQVIALIGNLTTFLVNLGIGLAPIGTKILGIVNNMLAWTNNMMEAHPIIGQIISVIVVLAGALIALTPAIIAATTLFGGFGTKLFSVVGSVLKFAGPALMKIGGFILRLGSQFLLTAGRIAMSALIAMGPWGWVAAAVIALVAVIIANWDKIKEWTSKTWTAISNLVKFAATVILSYIKQNFPELYNVIMSYMENAKIIISTVWEYIKGTFKNVLAFLKALVKGDFQGMKDAISNQMELAKSTISKIWGAIKSFFSTVLSNIASVVKKKFAEFVVSIGTKLVEAKQKVENIWNDIISFLKGINLVDIGKNIIQGLIDGVIAMGDSLVESAKGFVNDAIEGAKNLLGIHSPSRVFKQIGIYTGEGFIIGMQKMVSGVKQQATNLAKAAIPNTKLFQFKGNSPLTKYFNAILEDGDYMNDWVTHLPKSIRNSVMDIGKQFAAFEGLQVSANGFTQIRQDIGAESNFEMPQPIINVYNEWDGEQVRTYVERGNARNSRITDGFGGK